MAEAPRTNLLPTTDRERTVQDTQRTNFTKEAYDKEAEQLGLHVTNAVPLTAYQKQLLDTIRAIDANPVNAQAHVKCRLFRTANTSIQIVISLSHMILDSQQIIFLVLELQVNEF